MARLVFVAPLPPPVHGFSVINREMLGRLGPVDAVDVAPHRLGAGSLLAAWLRTAGIAGGRGGTLYVALSGGGRQLLDLAFVLAARIAGRRIFIHHHSYAYLARRPWYTRLLLAAAGPARHVVLCEGMGRSLAGAYRLSPEAIRVLSNVAFLDPPERNAAPPAAAPLRVGYLSAVSAEKGAYAFLDALAAAAGRGLAVEGLMAGPVAGAEAERFAAALAAAPQARHLGALYGEAKERFLASLDLLLFPTAYVNEAEPVTIWEALGHGVPVVANARGCIAGMLPALAAWVVGPAETFTDRALAAMEALSADPAARPAMRSAAAAQFDAARLRHRAGLSALLAEMTEGTDADAAA